MAFIPLPPARKDGFKCYYCGKVFKYEKAAGTKRGYELYDEKSDSYHDLERCKKKNDNFAEENRRQQPMYYFAKQGISYWKFKYSVEPKKPDDVVKTLCSCNAEQIYPVMLKDFKYWFNTTKLTNILYKYWCGNCGLELSQSKVTQWFSEYDFTKIQEENRIKSTWQ